MGAIESVEPKIEQFVVKSPRGKKYAWLRKFEGSVDADDARRLAQDVLAAASENFKKMSEKRKKKDRTPSTHELYPAAYRIATQPTKVRIDLTGEDVEDTRIVLARLTLTDEAKGCDALSVSIVGTSAVFEAEFDAGPENPVFCVAYVERWFPFDRSEGTRLELFVRSRVKFETGTK